MSFPIVLYCYVVHQYRGRGADKGRTGDSQGEGSGVAFTEACLLQAHFSILLATNRNWTQKSFYSACTSSAFVRSKTVPVLQKILPSFLTSDFFMGMFAVSRIFLVLRMQINCSRCFREKKNPKYKGKVTRDG